MTGQRPGLDEARQRRRAALDAHFAKATGYAESGLADYVQRLRRGHGAVVDGDGRYCGCSCGETFCGKDYLLAWCDELAASYEAKVAELAKETLRASDLAVEVASLRAELTS